MNWTGFPTVLIDTTTPLFRIHQNHLDPAWFSTDGTWRFDPMPSHRNRFGVCYLGVEALAAYVEVFGRMRLVPESEVTRRRLSTLSVAISANVADLTNRRVLGDYEVTAAHSTGTDYGPAQGLACQLFDAGLDGVLYRVRHDPAMTLEAVALFGEPGETPLRFTPPKTVPIPTDLINEGHQFGIEVLPTAPLP